MKEVRFEASHPTPDAAGSAPSEKAAKPSAPCFSFVDVFALPDPFAGASVEEVRFLQIECQDDLGAQWRQILRGNASGDVVPTRARVDERLVSEPDKSKDSSRMKRRALRLTAQETNFPELALAEATAAIARCTGQCAVGR